MIKEKDKIMEVSMSTESDIGKNKGGAPLGNVNAIKLKDPQIRHEAYKQYCVHLAKGKSKKSWYFDHPELRCTWETMEKYLKDEVEFDPLHKQIAMAEGLAYWEGQVFDAATGKNKNANTAALQMIMRNKYGWDRSDDPDSSRKEEMEAGLEQIKAIGVALMGPKS